MDSSGTSDVENNAGDYPDLTNTAVRSFGWTGVTVTVADRQTKQPKDILSDVNGIVKAGKHIYRRSHPINEAMLWR
jgi:hypothetical protein